MIFMGVTLELLRLEGNKSSYTRDNLPDSAAGFELGCGLLQLAGGPLEVVIPSRTCFFANCCDMFFFFVNKKVCVLDRRS